MREENLKSKKREVTLAYKTASIRLTVDFYSGTMEDRQQWNNIFKVLRVKQTKLSIMKFIFRKLLLKKKKLRDS